MPSYLVLLSRISFSWASVGDAAASRLAQAEEASRLVKWRGEFQASAVGHRHLRGALPIRRAEARDGFENKCGVRERPGKGEACVGARDAEVNAGGCAAVQNHRQRQRKAPLPRRS